MTTDIHFGTDGWRAVIGDDFTYESLRRVADAAGRVFSADNPGGTILVGYDTRFEAGSFAAAAAEVMAAHGLTVKVSDRYLPTPALCFSVARDDAAVGGVMLTASHNPSEYLGFKLRMADGGASPVEFTDRVEAELLAEPPVAARRVRARRPRRPVPREPAGHGRCRGDPRGEPARGRRPALRRRPDLPRRDAPRARRRRPRGARRAQPGLRRSAPRAHPAVDRLDRRAGQGRRRATPRSSPTATPTASARSTATATS